jgi:hypothetical protein
MLSNNISYWIFWTDHDLLPRVSIKEDLNLNLDLVREMIRVAASGTIPSDRLSGMIVEWVKRKERANSKDKIHKHTDLSLYHFMCPHWVNNENYF